MEGCKMRQMISGKHQDRKETVSQQRGDEGNDKQIAPSEVRELCEGGGGRGRSLGNRVNGDR